MIGSNRNSWFVTTVRSLIEGDVGFIARNNPIDLRSLALMCQLLDENGFARRSRQGWATIDHPEIGTVQWKLNLQAGLLYFYFMVNGKLILKCRQGPGARKTHAEWVTAPAESIAKLQARSFLGSLEEGTELDLAARERIEERRYALKK